MGTLFIPKTKSGQGFHGGCPRWTLTGSYGLWKQLALPSAHTSGQFSGVLPMACSAHAPNSDPVSAFMALHMQARGLARGWSVSPYRGRAGSGSRPGLAMAGSASLDGLPLVARPCRRHGGSGSSRKSSLHGRRSMPMPHPRPKRPCPQSPSAGCRSLEQLLQREPERGLQTRLGPPCLGGKAAQRLGAGRASSRQRR